MISEINVPVSGQGLYSITSLVASLLAKTALEEGLCTLFIRHTSASLLVQENYDDSAREDLERWLNRLVPEDDPLYTHTLEGPDDMPAHIKAVLTQTSLSIPVSGGRMALGTWQGIYLFEHRDAPHTRRVVAYFLTSG